MKNMNQEVIETLAKDSRLVSNDGLLKNMAIELALKLDEDLVNLLLSNERIKEHFFIEGEEVIIFMAKKFIKFINNKEFLPDSYTTFKNKIGLSTGQHRFLEQKDVVLIWPYKDCVLKGGQEKRDEKREEVFFNEILAPDQIDVLKAPKVFSKFRRIDENGEHKIAELRYKENLLIRGNNLLALYSIKKRYSGRIKLIYIDPPYNIGNDEFRYNDSFEHSTWLTFMKNRLEVAKELLREDGAIFVQIDYHELAYLSVMMDEIFGSKNRIQIISVKKATPAGFKVVNPGPVNVTEFLLYYAKDRRQYDFRDTYVEAEYVTDYNEYVLNPEDDVSEWQTKKVRDRIYEKMGVKGHKEAREKYGNSYKIIKNQLSADFALANADRVFATYNPHKPTGPLKELVKSSKKKPEKIFYHERESHRPFHVRNGRSLAFYKNKLKSIDGKLVPTELLTDFWSDLSWDVISGEGGVTLRRGKKPEKLLKRILEMASNKGDIVLDFFLGSGTTAAVAHKMGRQYIGIEQLDYGKDDATQRLRNVISGDKTGISKAVDWKGGGSFVYCELRELNAKYLSDVTKANSEEDLVTIWQEMQQNGFLSYRVDTRKIKENFQEFENLDLKEQKRILIDILDKNHLYVNYSEIEDKDYEISAADKKMNRQFYSTPESAIRF